MFLNKISDTLPLIKKIHLRVGKLNLKPRKIINEGLLHKEKAVIKKNKKLRLYFQIIVIKASQLHKNEVKIIHL